MHIALNGKDYLIRYPLAACRSLERELDKSVFEIHDDVVNGRVGINLMVALIWAGILHENRAITIDLVSLWLEDVKTPLPELYQACLVEFFQSIASRIGTKAAEASAEKN